MARTNIEPVTSETNAPKYWVLILAVVAAAMSTAEIISGSMLPLMAAGLNTTEGMAGQAVTASAITSIFTSLWIGKIAGNHDRRRLMIVFIIFLIASNVGVAMAPNVWFMLGARLLLGVAIGIIWGLIPAVVLRLSPKGQFSRSFAMVMIGVSTASLIGAPLSAYIGALLSWRVVYLGATALAILALVLLVVAFPPLPARPGVLNRDIRGTFRLPGMMTGMLAILLLFGGAQTFFGYVVPFLETVTGLNASGISMALLLVGVSGLAGTLTAPRLLTMSIRGVLVIAPATMAVLLGLLLMFGHMIVPTLLIIMAWWFARSMMGVGANAWIADRFSDNVEGAGGVLVAVIQTAMMLGAILGGVLIDTSGPGVPPIAGAIILVIGSIVTLFAMRPPSVQIPDIEMERLHTPGSLPLGNGAIVADELA